MDSSFSKDKARIHYQTRELKVPVDAALWAGFIFITALRMACVSFKWKISYFLKEEQEKTAQEK